MATKFERDLQEATEKAVKAGIGPAATAMDVRFLIGAQLLRRRRELDLTQKEVESRAGIPQSEISRIERGSANATVETLGAIASALDATITLVPVGATDEERDTRETGFGSRKLQLHEGA